MNRRQLLKATIAGAVLTTAAGSGALWFYSRDVKPSLTVANALLELEKMQTIEIGTSGEWNPSQIFNHCAQSIEFSMSGYPEHKSELFKTTVGQLAFSAFAANGKMIHGLSEPIPGAPALPSGDDVVKALSRLQQAFIAFDNYVGELAPHFAYGELTKSEYQLAHTMHLFNHLQEIQT